MLKLARQVDAFLGCEQLDVARRCRPSLCCQRRSTRNLRSPTQLMPSNPSGMGLKSTMCAVVPTSAVSATAPTSAPARIDTTPNGQRSRMQ